MSRVWAKATNPERVSSLIAFDVRILGGPGIKTGREVVDPVTWRRGRRYDDFAHELFNNMVNVFSRTSSVNHKALILRPIQCDDLGQQKWLTH